MIDVLAEAIMTIIVRSILPWLVGRRSDPKINSRKIRLDKSTIACDAATLFKSNVHSHRGSGAQQEE